MPSKFKLFNIKQFKYKKYLRSDNKKILPSINNNTKPLLFKMIHNFHTSYLNNKLVVFKQIDNTIFKK